VPIDLDEELKFLEEWLEKPKISKDYIEVATLSYECMKEDGNKREFHIPRIGIEGNLENKFITKKRSASGEYNLQEKNTLVEVMEYSPKYGMGGVLDEKAIQGFKFKIK
jgi:hypothetical protein